MSEQVIKLERTNRSEPVKRVVGLNTLRSPGTHLKDWFPSSPEFSLVVPP